MKTIKQKSMKTTLGLGLLLTASGCSFLPKPPPMTPEKAEAIKDFCAQYFDLSDMRYTECIRKRGVRKNNYLVRQSQDSFQRQEQPTRIYPVEINSATALGPKIGTEHQPNGEIETTYAPIPQQEIPASHSSQTHMRSIQTDPHRYCVTDYKGDNNFTLKIKSRAGNRITIAELTGLSDDGERPGINSDSYTRVVKNTEAIGPIYAARIFNGVCTLNTELHGEKHYELDGKFFDGSMLRAIGDKIDPSLHNELYNRFIR